MNPAEWGRLALEAYVIYFILLPAGALVVLGAEIVGEWRQRRRIRRILKDKK